MEVDGSRWNFSCERYVFLPVERLYPVLFQQRGDFSIDVQSRSKPCPKELDI